MIQLYRRLRQDQSGGVALWAAVSFIALGGIAALAVDFGRMAVVKSELQKAADAGALAGARTLSLGPPYPNWTDAQISAQAAAAKNGVNGSLITSCQVQVGYWDYSWRQTTAPANLLSTGTIPTAQIVPAVKVSVSKADGQNGGPLLMLFGPLLGIASETVQARTVACSKLMPVNCVSAGMAFPLATPETFVKQLWGKDPPESFRIGSSYHDPTGGQWTSFLTQANDVPTIRELIDSGNPGPLKVGDLIWIEPGTKTTLYNEAATRIGETVMLPIVPDDFQTHATAPVLAFVAFYIEDAQGGSDKYIQGHFVKDYTVPGGIGAEGTPNYGGMAGTPKLIN
ncbi:MAG: TadG family pilus assembly protein [Desulfobaccales bacterium]